MQENDLCKASIKHRLLHVIDKLCWAYIKKSVQILEKKKGSSP